MSTTALVLLHQVHPLQCSGVEFSMASLQVALVLAVCFSDSFFFLHMKQNKDCISPDKESI